MGVWGTKPFDSDQALDWYSRISDVAVREVERALKNNDINDWSDWYAAAGVILLLGRIPDVRLQELAPLAVRRINQLRSDKEFFATWRNPREFQRDSAKVLMALQSMIKEQPRTSLMDKWESIDPTFEDDEDD